MVVPAAVGAGSAHDTDEQRPLDDTSSEDVSLQGAESSSDPEDEAKQLRDRLAGLGREAKEFKDRTAKAEALAAQQQAELDATRARLASIETHLTKQEEARRQAYLASLPPDQRAAAELSLLKKEVEQLRTGGVAPTARPAPAAPPAKESPEQYAERRGREIVAEAQDDFEVTLTEEQIRAIYDSEAGESEQAFKKAVRAAARTTAQEGTMATKKAETPEPGEDIDSRIMRAVRTATGVSGPNAARGGPAARKTVPTDAEFRAATSTYDSKAGPKANIKALQALRDRTERALG